MEKYILTCKAKFVKAKFESWLVQKFWRKFKKPWSLKDKWTERMTEKLNANFYKVSFQFVYLN